jgi:FtsP/CotA-like multicopper oxidase with cupredoxin domain
LTERTDADWVIVLDCLLVGMGERYDVTVTLTASAHSSVSPREKDALARALIRTGVGSAPNSNFLPGELTGRPVQVGDLQPREDVRVPARAPDHEFGLRLRGGMMSYHWAIDGAGPDPESPLTVRQGERVRMSLSYDSMMWPPMHVHGHTFAVGPAGAPKDTVAVLPGQTVVWDFDANNPGSG